MKKKRLEERELEIKEGTLKTIRMLVKEEFKPFWLGV